MPPNSPPPVPRTLSLSPLSTIRAPANATEDELARWRANVVKNQQRFKAWVRGRVIGEDDRTQGLWVSFMDDRAEPVQRGQTVAEAVRGLSGPVFIGHMITDGCQEPVPMFVECFEGSSCSAGSAVVIE